MSAAAATSKKRKVVNDGLFYAELNEFFQRELGEDGYAGCEVRVTPMRTEIVIRATRTQNVLGEKGRRIRELTSFVQKRFNFPEGNVELYAERSAQRRSQQRQSSAASASALQPLTRCVSLCLSVLRVHNRALSAIAQAESLRFKLMGGLAVRRACYGVLRYIMDNGAKGCELVISGKMGQQRAKAMKFRAGYMIKSGDAVNHYVDYAVRHIKLKQVSLTDRQTVRALLQRCMTVIENDQHHQPNLSLSNPRSSCCNLSHRLRPPTVPAAASASTQRRSPSCSSSAADCSTVSACLLLLRACWASR
jgi:small subunit ribosomal protein S3e